MTDFESPTIVTILGFTQLGSIDTECKPTIIASVMDEFGKTHKIYLHNFHQESLLKQGNKIVVQWQKLPQNNMAREYKVWRDKRTYRAMAKQNIL